MRTSVCLFVAVLQRVCMCRGCSDQRIWYAKGLQVDQYTVVIYYSSLDTSFLRMVVGLFLSRVRLPGTACATNCENRC